MTVARRHGGWRRGVVGALVAAVALVVGAAPRAAAEALTLSVPISMKEEIGRASCRERV